MIQFIDLAEQYRHLQININQNIQKVLDHGKYILGPEITELEQNLADYVNVRHAITCSNGTDALLMPLLTWGTGIGDIVFTTPFTFIATAEVVSLLGATPVFVDIDPETYNIDVTQLEQEVQKAINSSKSTPKVIIPVDLFGLPADYEGIEATAHKYGLKVLEDTAQGFGSIYKGKKAGSFGDAAATSFFPAKPLGCYGDGGAIFTDDASLAEKLISVRVHGQGSKKYENVRTGINGRLDTIQAAILLAKLKVFDEELEARNRIASIYSLGLKGILKTPAVPDGSVSCWAQYSVLAQSCEERDLLCEKLRSEGIPTAVYYPKPLHLQEAFSYLGYREGDFPASEEASRRIFSLPMHPYLKDEIVEKIITSIQSFYK